MPGRAAPVVTPKGLAGVAVGGPVRLIVVVIGLGLEQLTEPTAEVGGRFGARRCRNSRDGGVLVVVGIVRFVFDRRREPAQRLRSRRPRQPRASPLPGAARCSSRGSRCGRTRTHSPSRPPAGDRRCSRDAAQQRLDHLLLVSVLEFDGDGRAGEPLGVHDARPADARPLVENGPDRCVLGRQIDLAAMERDLDRLAPPRGGRAPSTARWREGCGPAWRLS